MKREDVEDLDEEIESAVDSLFVESGADRGIEREGTQRSISEQAEPIPDISPEVMEESLRKEEPEETVLEGKPIEEEVAPPADEKPEPVEKPSEEEKLPKGVESLEVEVLSLEWEFNAETIKKIISALGGLKAAYREDESLLRVIDMMGKVSLYLLNDEKSITPEALRFLQDGKEVIKFLATQKGEQTIFRNLVVEGINSHFHLLGLEKEAKRDEARDEVFEKLCSDLEKHRMRLGDGEDRLGKAIGRIKGMGDELIFDDGIAGLSDELERIQGSLRSFLGSLGDISGEFQRELFGQRLFGAERVLLVETQNRIFGIPSRFVMKSHTLSDGYAKNITSQSHVSIRGKRIPLVKLSKVFNLDMVGARNPQGVVLAGEGDHMIALLVDRVLTHKSLLVKTAEQEGKGLKYIAAISHLESGKMVYILNIDRLKVHSQP